MEKSYITYKDLISARTILDQMAYQEESEAYLALKKYMLDTIKFVENNPTEKEDEMLDKIEQSTAHYSDVALVEVRGKWYQAKAIVREQRIVILSESVVDGSHDIFANSNYVFVHEIAQVKI